jgi:rubrerythrin
MKTNDNLKKAFAGESQANRKYTAFSIKAVEEKFFNTARLFRAIAEAETVHALNHLRAMNAVKSTKENLQEALSGEIYEFTEMYPDFIKTASEEKSSTANVSFNFANQVEKLHGKLYEKALESIENGKDIETKMVFVCGVCGCTIENEAPGICPVCGAPKDKFKKIN